MNSQRTTIGAEHRERVRASTQPAWVPSPSDDSVRRRVASEPARADARRSFTFDSPLQDSSLVALHGVHVMLVEDNVDARNIIRRVLEHCGAVVTVTETARGALR